MIIININISTKKKRTNTSNAALKIDKCFKLLDDYV